MWEYWLIRMPSCCLGDARCMHSVNCIHSDIRQIRSSRIERRAHSARNKKSIIKRRRANQRTEEGFSSRFFFLFFRFKTKATAWVMVRYTAFSLFSAWILLALKSSISFIKIFSSFFFSVVCRYWAMETKTSGSLDISCFLFFFVGDYDGKESVRGQEMKTAK